MFNIIMAGVLDMMKNQDKSMEKIVALCKGRGFIFAGSEIYGGLANTWDYGPLGSRLKNNVKDTWRKRFIQERKNSYEVDADILMHPRVWLPASQTLFLTARNVKCVTEPIILSTTLTLKHMQTA